MRRFRLKPERRRFCIRDLMLFAFNSMSSFVVVRFQPLLGRMQRVATSFRPANLENVFRGTFRVKKRDLPAKSGTVGRAHIEIFYKYRAYRNQLRSKIHCSTDFLLNLAGRGTSGKKAGLSRQKRDGWQVCSLCPVNLPSCLHIRHC